MNDYQQFCPLRSNVADGRIDCSPDCRWLVNTGEVGENGLDRYACAVTVIAERLIRQQAGE